MNFRGFKDMAKQAKTIEVRDIVSNDDTTFHAEVTPGVSIRIFGVRFDKPFDKTFKIGDAAEYHSYNFSYFGNITRIGEKTVTIQHYPHEKRATRLTLDRFVWRNHGDEAQKHERRNAWYD